MCHLFLNILFLFLVNMKNPKSDSLSVEETGEESQQEFYQTQLRLNYVLFLLPLVVVFGVVSIMYIKHCIRNRIRNLIQLLDKSHGHGGCRSNPSKSFRNVRWN